MIDINPKVQIKNKYIGKLTRIIDTLNVVLVGDEILGKHVPITKDNYIPGSVAKSMIVNALYKVLDKSTLAAIVNGIPDITRTDSVDFIIKTVNDKFKIEGNPIFSTYPIDNSFVRSIIGNGKAYFDKHSDMISTKLSFDVDKLPDTSRNKRSLTVISNQSMLLTHVLEYLYPRKAFSEEELEMLKFASANMGPLDIPFNGSDQLRSACLGINLLRGYKCKPKRLTDILMAVVYLGSGVTELTPQTKIKNPSTRVRKIIYPLIDKMINEEELSINSTLWQRLFFYIHFGGKSVRPESKILVNRLFGEGEPLRSYAGKLDIAFSNEHPQDVLNLLAKRPGMLWKNVTRVLRKYNCANELLNTIHSTPGIIEKATPAILYKVCSSMHGIFTGQGESDYVIIDGVCTRKNSDRTQDPIDPKAAKIVYDNLYHVMLGLISINLTKLGITGRPRFTSYGYDLETVMLPEANKTAVNTAMVAPIGTSINLGNLEGKMLRVGVAWEAYTDVDLSFIDSTGDILNWHNLNTNSDIDLYHSGDVRTGGLGSVEYIDFGVNNRLNVGDSALFDVRDYSSNTPLAGKGIRIGLCITDQINNESKIAAENWDINSTVLLTTAEANYRSIQPFLVSLNDKGETIVTVVNLSVTEGENIQPVVFNRVENAMSVIKGLDLNTIMEEVFSRRTTPASDDIKIDIGSTTAIKLFH